MSTTGAAALERRQADLRDPRRVSLLGRCRNRQAVRGLWRQRPHQPALRGDAAAGRALLGHHRPAGCRQYRRRHRQHGGRRRHRHQEKEAAPEDVRGFDAITGKLVWTFHVVPREGEFGTDTWGKDQQGIESWKYAGDLGAWNQMTADDELGYVYLPLTAPSASAWGVLAARRQSVRRLPGRARRQDRQAGLALPDGSSRPVGIRHRRPGDARRHQGRRPADQGGGAAEQERLPVGSRSHQRQAGMAGRRAAGAAVDGPGREDLADAAVPDQAAAVRASGCQRRRPDRLHAGAEGARPRDRQRLRDRAAVHPALDRDRRAGHQQRHADAAGLVRRRRTGTPADSIPTPGCITPSPTRCRCRIAPSRRTPTSRSW